MRAADRDNFCLASMRHHERLKQIALGSAFAAVALVAIASLISSLT